jgi:NitT/TauT family transport system substrate-binding protein
MSHVDRLIADFRNGSVSRRQFIQGAAALGLSFSAISRLSNPVLAGSAGAVRWVSPRGTLDVLDDYPYWVAQKFGYFGDIKTTIEPGPTSGQGKLVAADQSDMSYSSPGVFSFDLEADVPLVSVFQMGAYDVFDFAFPKGKAVSSLKELEGKKVLIGDASWQGICAPEIAQQGGDPSKVQYLVAGLSWQENLQQGQGDAALSWEGLRAQWKSLGFDFDYLLGMEFSKFPANSFQIRSKDFQDSSLTDTYTKYLAGWAAGLEFGHLNPRAATQITMEARPQVKQAFPDRAVAVESMMQLATVFRGDFAKRQGWGWHDLEGWQLFLDTIKKIGQITKDIKAEDVIKNDYVAGANAFDKAKVQSDAASFQLADEFAKVPDPNAATPEATPAS